MNNFRYNFISNNINNSLVSMMEFFINSKIFPKKIFYLSCKTIMNPLFFKININELDITYDNNAIILIDFFTTSQSLSLIKKLKKIKKLVIISDKNIYFTLFEMDYIYSNPFFKNEVMKHRNKTLEDNFTRLCLRNQVYYRKIHPKFKENNFLEYSLDNTQIFNEQNYKSEEITLDFC